MRSLDGGISTVTCAIESPPKSDISTVTQSYVFLCLLIADGGRFHTNDASLISQGTRDCCFCSASLCIRGEDGYNF